MSELSENIFVIRVHLVFAELLTLSGPAFSVVHQARVGLRGPDAKNQS